MISRVFDAPRELLWECFTDPERMKQWFGPRGSTVVASKMDLRLGGTYHGGMSMPNGQVMWGKFVYREITAPERLVLVNSFSDEAGGMTRHPMSPTWPLELLTTFTFEEDLSARPSSRCAGRRSTPPKPSSKPSMPRMTACGRAGAARSISSTRIWRTRGS